MWAKIRMVGIIGLNTLIFAEVAVYFCIVFGLDTPFYRDESPLPGNTQQNIVAGSIVFDKVNGYRIKDCPFRYIRMYSGRPIFDNETCMNSAGFRSRYEFSTEKPDNLKRVIVLGDSFTHMWYAKTPWTDVLELNLPDTQVYNMALAGVGIVNWHSTYFETVRKIEHDTLVIAVTTGDLARPFAVVETAGTDYMFGRFDSIPGDNEDFEANYRPSMDKIGQVVTQSEADRIVSKFDAPRWVPIRPYFLSYLYAVAKGEIKLGISNPFQEYVDRLNEPDPSLKYSIEQQNFLRDPEAVVASDLTGDVYTEKHKQMLLDIIENETRAGVRVILVSVPLRPEIVHMTLEGRKTFEETLLEQLAHELGVEFFSGQSAFEGESLESVLNDYWLPYDGHWSEKGGARFAEALAGYLSKPGAEETGVTTSSQGSHP